VSEIKSKSQAKGITRFISTHPDDDHIRDLVYLDDQIGILNFYVVANEATKPDESDDFYRYCALRDSSKAFFIYAGCRRKWMNLNSESSDEQQRKMSGIHILWPKTENKDFKEALQDAADGIAFNNISAIVRYGVEDGPVVLWMGDMETAFMEKIEKEVEWPKVDILFAPHHGRDSGKIPQSILDKLDPKLVVIGEAPCDHLNYYTTCDTITQNAAGDITFDCDDGWVHVYVSDKDYESTCLTNLCKADNEHGRYVGSLAVHAPAAAAA
jgi:beta-lactamase superfamily II metal-dependent hydrolase